MATVGLDVIPPIRLRVIMSGLSLSFKTWVSLPVYLLAQLYSRTIHAKTYCPNSILIPLTYRGVTACEHISSTALYTHTHKHTVYRRNSGSSPPIRQQKRRGGGEEHFIDPRSSLRQVNKKGAYWEGDRHDQYEVGDKGGTLTECTRCMQPHLAHQLSSSHPTLSH